MRIAELTMSCKKLDFVSSQQQNASEWAIEGRFCQVSTLWAREPKPAYLAEKKCWSVVPPGTIIQVYIAHVAVSALYGLFTL